MSLLLCNNVDQHFFVVFYRKTRTKKDIWYNLIYCEPLLVLCDCINKSLGFWRTFLTGGGAGDLLFLQVYHTVPSTGGLLYL